MTDDKASAADELEDGVVDEQQQNQEQQKQQQQKKPDDNADLKAAMSELAGAVKTIAEKDKPTEKQLTQEEINEAWAIYDPEKSQKDFFRKYFRLNPDATEEEVKAVKDLFADMQKGIVKQSVVGARNVMLGEFEKIREEIKPLMDYVTGRRSKETREAFNTAFPVFADPKYDKVVNATAKTLKQEDFKSDEDYFKALAESAAETIKQILPDFDLGKVEEKKKPAATTPKLPRTSVGGTGGTSGGSSQASAGPSGDQSNELVD